MYHSVYFSGKTVATIGNFSGYEELLPMLIHLLGAKPLDSGDTILTPDIVIIGTDVSLSVLDALSSKSVVIPFYKLDDYFADVGNGASLDGLMQAYRRSCENESAENHQRVDDDTGENDLRGIHPYDPANHNKVIYCVAFQSGVCLVQPIMIKVEDGTYVVLVFSSDRDKVGQRYRLDDWVVARESLSMYFYDNIDIVAEVMKLGITVDQTAVKAALSTDPYRDDLIKVIMEHLATASPKPEEVAYWQKWCETQNNQALEKMLHGIRSGATFVRCQFTGAIQFGLVRKPMAGSNWFHNQMHWSNN